MKQAILIKFPVERPITYGPRLIKLAEELKITPKDARDFVRGYGLRFRSDNNE